VWYTDAFGWPITARPLSSTGTVERIEVSEVVSKMVQRACDIEPVKKVTVPTTTATASTTTASTVTVKSRFKDVVEEVKEVLTESYPDLVSFCFF